MSIDRRIATSEKLQAILQPLLRLEDDAMTELLETLDAYIDARAEDLDDYRHDTGDYLRYD